MYEVFKVMQGVAEKCGTINAVEVHKGDRIWSDGVEISGVTAEGKKFTLKYSEESADE